MLDRSYLDEVAHHGPTLVFATINDAHLWLRFAGQRRRLARSLPLARALDNAVDSRSLSRMKDAAAQAAINASLASGELRRQGWEIMLNIPEKTVVLTSTYVVHDRQPVLVVAHDEPDGEGIDWQFHC